MTQALAAVMRAERARRDITNVALADRTGLSLSTIQRLMKGQRDIDLIQLALIAQALDLRPSDLVAAAEGAPLLPPPRTEGTQ